jgi:hypothetical protein
MDRSTMDHSDLWGMGWFQMQEGDQLNGRSEAVQIAASCGFISADHAAIGP